MGTSSLQDQPVVGQITLRYWASARARAGVAEEQVDVPGPVTLASLVDVALARRAGDPLLQAVLASCSVLVGDRPVGTEDPDAVLVAPGESVEFLPPFAGG
ncbi:MAG: thiamine biosynthesis protein ThiS [Marmoricola sp.]|nr:thiamine biosynthesis protein ThiS [Marmoricola sp.]